MKNPQTISRQTTNQLTTVSKISSAVPTTNPHLPKNRLTKSLLLTKSLQMKNQLTAVSKISSVVATTNRLRKPKKRRKLKKNLQPKKRAMTSLPKTVWKTCSARTARRPPGS